MLGHKKNIGLIDRIVRILAGVALILIAGKNVPQFGWSLLLILSGIYFFITGVLGRSPLYTILGHHSDERLK